MTKASIQYPLMTDNLPHRDEDVLRHLYHEKGLSSIQIADRLGVSKQTVLGWMKRHDIPRRSKEENNQPPIEADKLRELYWDDGLTMYEIGDRIGRSQPAVSRWMDKFDIERQDQDIAVSNGKGPLSMVTNESGYELFKSSYGGEQNQVYVHRLCAVAWFGIDAIKESEVHHKNGITWDNRQENIGTLSESEHKKLHYQDRETDSKGRFV